MAKLSVDNIAAPSSVGKGINISASNNAGVGNFAALVKNLNASPSSDKAVNNQFASLASHQENPKQLRSSLEEEAKNNNSLSNQHGAHDQAKTPKQEATPAKQLAEKNASLRQQQETHKAQQQDNRENKNNEAQEHQTVGASATNETLQENPLESQCADESTIMEGDASVEAGAFLEETGTVQQMAPETLNGQLQQQLSEEQTNSASASQTRQKAAAPHSPNDINIQGGDKPEIQSHGGNQEFNENEAKASESIANVPLSGASRNAEQSEYESANDDKQDGAVREPIPPVALFFANSSAPQNQDLSSSNEDSGIRNAENIGNQGGSWVGTEDSKNFAVNGNSQLEQEQSNINVNASNSAAQQYDQDETQTERPAAANNSRQEEAGKKIVADRNKIPSAPINYDKQQTRQELTANMQANSLHNSSDNQLAASGSFEQNQQGLMQEGNNSNSTFTASNNGNQFTVVFKEMPVSSAASQQDKMSSPSEQIKMAVRAGRENGNNLIAVKLHPEGLGEVNIEIQTSAAGKQTINITTSQQETLQMLIHDERQLKEAISSITGDNEASLSFNLQDRQSGSDLYQQAEQGFAGINDISNANNSVANSANYQVSITPLQQVDLENGKVNIIA